MVTSVAGGLEEGIPLPMIRYSRVVLLSLYHFSGFPNSLPRDALDAITSEELYPYQRSLQIN